MSLSHRKAQVAIEFMLIISVMLMAFLFFTGMIAMKHAEKNRENLFKEFQATALLLSNELRLASTTSVGYSRSFEMPAKIRNIDYEVQYTKNADDTVRGMQLVPTDAKLDYFATVLVPEYIKIPPTYSGSSSLKIEKTAINEIFLTVPSSGLNFKPYASSTP